MQITNVQTGRVTTEGDDLYYEVRGAGRGTEVPALLMIPPGGGDGFQYAAAADLLADEYKVITYDRRANGRSTINHPQNFEVSQQSRDAVAVLHAAGERSAYIFGSSSGAVIALDLASTQPQAARAIVAHEAPIPRMLPDAQKWQHFFASVYAMSFSWGVSLAALRFMLGAQLPVQQLIKATRGINAHRAQSSEPYLSDQTATEVLIRWELLPVTNYLPNPARIRQNGVNIYLAISEWALAKKTWYAQANQNLAGQLGCEPVTFPGHHGSYMDMPREFAAALRATLSRPKQASVKANAPSD